MSNGKISATYNPVFKASAKALKALAKLGFISSQVLTGKLSIEAEKLAMRAMLAEKKAARLAAMGEKQ